MTLVPDIQRPLLARGARYRWDELRGQHQLVYPEGLLVLTGSAAAIVRLCDGRPMGEIITVLHGQFPGADPGPDVHAFLERLAGKGLVRDAGDA
jgi:pyrroloquinoline quinone biosynthesis protein D